MPKYQADFRDDLAFLSNMYPSPFVVNGNEFPTNEHYFVFHKLKKTTDKIKALNCKTPNEVKFLGRHAPMVEDWDRIKDSVMFTGLRHKFEQNPDLLQKLLDTGNDILEEGNTWGDKYWGVDYYTREGKNMLGKLLMKVREHFRKNREAGD